MWDFFCTCYYSPADDLMGVLKEKLLLTSLADYAAKFNEDTYTKMGYSTKLEMTPQLLELLEADSIDAQALCNEAAFDDFLNFFICTSTREAKR